MVFMYLQLETASFCRYLTFYVVFVHVGYIKKLQNYWFRFFNYTKSILVWVHSYSCWLGYYNVTWEILYPLVLPGYLILMLNILNAQKYVLCTMY